MCSTCTSPLTDGEPINIDNSKYLLALTMGPVAMENNERRDPNAAIAEGTFGVFKALQTSTKPAPSHNIVAVGLLEN